MVAGHDVKLVAQVLDLVLEALRRLLIQMRDVGDGMQQVAQVQDEIDLARVQVTHHVAHAAVGQLVDLERRIAFLFTLVQVRVGDHRIGKKPLS